MIGGRWVRTRERRREERERWRSIAIWVTASAAILAAFALVVSEMPA